MLSDDIAVFHMVDMVLALDYLHATVGVVYRDLEPEKCLLDAEGHLLLTDFGLSKVALADETYKSLAGTTDFMVPEVLLGDGYGAAVDWWSLGALGLDLLTGSPPFAANNHRKIERNILYKKVAMPYYLPPRTQRISSRACCARTPPQAPRPRHAARPAHESR